MIPFNKPYLTGKELCYMNEAVTNGKISGNGIFTKRCQSFFEDKYNFKKCLLTTSCTDALEMAAILCDIHPGDEVIVPSYTFVSSALAFVRQGASIKFADSYSNNPNIDVNEIEKLITPNTKVIVPVHYAGVACDMDRIVEIAQKYNLIIVEDAAQAISSFYKGTPLGRMGHLSCFSFHETKNIISGEGGMLVINDDRFLRRAEIIWEKGTNRNEFYRGDVNKYGWMDIGSSFLPSELIAAFLYAQFENIDIIQQRRIDIWEKYNRELALFCKSNNVRTPIIPKYATNNGHMYYLVCQTLFERDMLIKHLKKNDILSTFHYQSLHNSPYYINKYKGPTLPNSDYLTDRLIRLPLFFELTDEEQQTIIDAIKSFYI